MEYGIYHAFKRRGELDSTIMFTNNLQIWCTIFAVTSFIASYFGQLLWGWWFMLKTPFGIEWVALGLGIFFILLFIAMAVYSLFLKLGGLLFHAKFGQNRI